MNWVCDRPFTTVDFGAAQLSCAQLMNKFVPGELVVARSVVMAGLGVCEMCMPVHNEKKLWYCGEASGNSSDISVTDWGDGQSQWVWQLRPACQTAGRLRSIVQIGFLSLIGVG